MEGAGTAIGDRGARAAWYGLGDRIEATTDGLVSRSVPDLALKNVGRIIKAAERLNLEQIGYVNDPEIWQKTLASAERAVAVKQRARERDRGIGIEL